MIYSKLVSYVQLSPHCVKRTHPVEGITPHHAAGNATVEALGALFASPSQGASANYGIGSDGRIACFVPEDYRAYTSSNAANDHRAITIEVANSGGAPNWPISDAAYKSLIELCVDICTRYGFKLNFTGDKTGNLTMHKYFVPTVCPGPYLEGKFPQIAEDVNRRLQGNMPAEEPQTKPETNTNKPKEGYTMNMRIMKQGDSGEDVRALQILLKGNGYDLGSYGPKKDGVDGQYGPATAKAVRALQTARNLDVDEIAGPQVMGSLLGV